MRSNSAIARSRMCRLGLVSGVALAGVIAFAVPAGANTGHVFTSQTCYTWSASVTLDNNVTTVRRVEITTTIPGTTGMVDGRYDTIGNSGTLLIWSASGTAPAAGTVTLTILNPDNSVDYTQSSSLQTLKDCTPSTTTTAPGPRPRWRRMPAPGPTTTTLPISNGVTTTTHVAPTTTVAPPPSTETTTSITVSPTTVKLTTTTTTPPQTTTPVTGQGSTSSLPVTTTSAAGGISTTLPRTGSSTSLPVMLGTGCLAVGAALGAVAPPDHLVPFVAGSAPVRAR